MISFLVRCHRSANDFVFSPWVFSPLVFCLGVWVGRVLGLGLLLLLAFPDPRTTELLFLGIRSSINPHFIITTIITMGAVNN